MERKYKILKTMFFLILGMKELFWRCFLKVSYWIAGDEHPPIYRRGA